MLVDFTVGLPLFCFCVLVAFWFLQQEVQHDVQTLCFSNSHYVLLVYADWCPWTRTSQVVFEEAAQRCPHIKFVMLPEPEARRKLNLDIQTFPTILQMRGSTILQTMKGHRTIENVVKFASINKIGRRPSR